MSNTVLNFKKGFTMYSKNKLSNNISWLQNTDLSDVIHKQQLHLNIEKQYQFIQKSEKENLIKILNLFKKEISDYYLSDRLLLKLEFMQLNETEYFMYLLLRFLLSNDVDNNRIFFHEYGVEMYKEILVLDSGDTHRDSIYTLTDFSKSYYKLFAIVLTYCENNKNILNAVPHIARYNRSEQIKEILNKDEFEVIT